MVDVARDGSLLTPTPNGRRTTMATGLGSVYAQSSVRRWQMDDVTSRPGFGDT
jgi:hypothetical protein